MSPKSSGRRSWNDNFSELVAYKAKTGSLQVASKHNFLSRWVIKQRSKFKEDRLSIEQIKKLEGIGFDFSRQSSSCHDHEHNWDDNFSKLVAYKAKTGNLHVSSQHSKVLQRWVNNQRSRFREGYLSSDRIKKLEGIGFDFSPQSTAPEHSWDDRFSELVAHKAKTGSICVSNKHSKVLQTWVHNQRSRFKEGYLSSDRQKKLEAIGFDFSPQSNWDDRFSELAAYKAKTGSFYVSSKHSTTLQNWVHNQRKMSKAGKLSRDQVEKLDGIGFDFAPQHTSTIGMLRHLRGFHNEFGHFCVPYDYKIDHDGRVVRLGRWVSKMRHKRKHGMIDEDLKQQLDSLGFVWNARTKPCKQYPPPKSNSSQKRGSQTRADDNLDNGSNNVASFVSDDCAEATITIGTPQLMRKKFWRPPTPYPMSDDDEDCCLGSW